MHGAYLKALIQKSQKLSRFVILVLLIPFIIMSNSELNKSDGCDVFFSLLIVLALLAGFFLFQSIMQPDEPANVDYDVEQTRMESIRKHKVENSAYLNQVDAFHSDNNSTLKSVMDDIIETYNK